MGIVQGLLMMAISIYLLTLSFSALDNETLKLLGESKDHAVDKNQRIDRKLANVFVMISFFCVICGGLAVAASWSQDAIMNYIFGYANLILMVAFVSVGMSIVILQCKFNSLLLNPSLPFSSCCLRLRQRVRYRHRQSPPNRLNV